MTHVQLIVATLLFCVSNATACLWDYDTLRDERRGLPGVAEALAGKWEKHDDYFYQHRIAQMQALLTREPDNLAAMDNLAVAYEKTGQVDKAIELMLTKLDKKPGEYTTHANLGTFYLHAGDFDRGIEHIKKAIEINPDAHFGREKYQLQVAEYIRDAKKDPKMLDRGSFVLPIVLGEDADADAESIEAHLRRVRVTRKAHDNQEVNDAITGIVGMVRFGTGTSPHLYFALGDLLAARGDKHLAYRAYRRALEFEHPRPELVTAAANSVQEMIEKSGTMDADFAKEKQHAAEWVKAYQAYERALIEHGKSTEDESNYDAFYRQHGKREGSLGGVWIDDVWRSPLLRVLGIVCIAIAAVLLLRLIKRRLLHAPTAA